MISGGLLQQVALSSAFFSLTPVSNPHLTFSALGPESEDEIFRLFKKLCEEKSGILISHRLSSSILVDKIILLENGNLIDSGTHDALIEKNGRYAELYRMQADKYKTAGKAS